MAFDDLYFDASFTGIGKKHLTINDRILKQSAGSTTLILLAIEDVLQRSDL